MTELIGWFGAGLLLLSYALLSLKKVTAFQFQYQAINIVASSCLLINAISNKAYPFVLLNLIWTLVAAYVLFRIVLGKAGEK